MKAQNGSQSYRVVNYRVSDFKDPELTILGETLCGLKFILWIDDKKILHFACNDTYDNCMLMKPNYKLNMGPLPINYKTVIRYTQEAHICNWYYSQQTHDTKMHLRMFDKFCGKDYKYEKYGIN